MTSLVTSLSSVFEMFFLKTMCLCFSIVDIIHPPVQPSLRLMSFLTLLSWQFLHFSIRGSYSISWSLPSISLQKKLVLLSEKLHYIWSWCYHFFPILLTAKTITYLVVTFQRKYVKPWGSERLLKRIWSPSTLRHSCGRDSLKNGNEKKTASSNAIKCNFARPKLSWSFSKFQGFSNRTNRPVVVTNTSAKSHRLARIGFSSVPASKQQLKRRQLKIQMCWVMFFYIYRLPDLPYRPLWSPKLACVII